MNGGIEIGWCMLDKMKLPGDISAIWPVSQFLLRNLKFFVRFFFIFGLYVGLFVQSKFIKIVSPSENGENLPSVESLYQRVSLIFVQSHRLLNKPRPMMPGIINIGGCHIKPPKPLENISLRHYLDQSTNGVIIFTMGSLLPSSDMPTKQRDAFLNSFRGLRQNVIWKFEDDRRTNIPSNVRIQSWLPQSDILAHPNVVLFITHGGMASTFEGMARGVPMLCIPVFADQHRNSHKLRALGIARVLSIEQVTVDKLSTEINEMLNNEEYTRKARDVGRLFMDFAIHPMDEAMHWIEHVIRSNGAEYLKSKAVNLYWFQYIGLDVWILIFACVLALYLIFRGILVVIRDCGKCSGSLILRISLLRIFLV